MDGRLYAVEAQTGKLRFSFETEGATLDSSAEGYDRTSITSSPSVSNDGIFFGSRDGHLYGIEKSGGAKRWRFGHKVSFVPGSPEVGWVVGSPALLEADGFVLVGSSDGKFFNAVRAQSGEEVWKFTTTERVFSSGAVADGSVFFGCDDGHLYALDARTGQERWRFATGAMIVSSPIVHAGTVLVGSDDGKLWALQTGPQRPGARPQRAVFWTDPGPWKWFDGDAATRDYFAREGYEVLDSAGLLRFLGDLSRAASSTVVMASDRLPGDATATAGEAEDSLLRRYLSAGGRMVWLGVAPDAVSLDPQTGKPAGFDPSRTQRLLGVDHAGQLGDRLPVQATPEGVRWGMPAWWIGGLTVRGEDVTTVLGRDETGRASAWIKRYGPKPGSGFVRLWGRSEAIPDLSWVQRVAEHNE